VDWDREIGIARQEITAPVGIGDQKRFVAAHRKIAD